MRKVGFAVLLAFISTYFAECVIQASSFVAQPLWSAFVTIPLYGLHALLLGRWAFRKGTPAFSTLFFCAMIFGLYEAYFTKILWTGWENDPVKFLGVSVVAFLLLVPWWHAFMAFMIPLLFAERYVLGWKDETALTPRKIRDWMADPSRARWTWAALGAFFGFYQAQVGIKSPAAPFLGFMDAMLLLVILLRWKPREEETLQTMLPTGRGLIVPVVWISLLFLWAGFKLLPEKMPALGAQVPIWVCYGMFAWLVTKSFRKEPLPEAGEWHPPLRASDEFLPFPVACVIMAAFTRLIPNLPVVAFFLCSLVGVIIGLRAVYLAFRQMRPARG